MKDPAITALAHRYEQMEIIGEGGMGRVYKAWDKKLQRWVALKVVLPRLLERSSDLAVKRFEREVRSMAKVTHRAIVRLFDVGHKDSCHYFAMEFLEGRNLRKLLEERKLPQRKVVEMVATLADGLAVVHDAGLLHRDIKPSNIHVCTDGSPKFLDFGLAAFVDEGEMSRVTKTGGLVGTLRYLPPEAVEGKRTDCRGDIYQLGVVLYEALVGQHPFAGRNFADLLKSVGRDGVTIPDGVDSRLAPLLQGAICPRPKERIQSAKELKDGLDGWLKGKPRKPVKATRPYSMAVPQAPSSKGRRLAFFISFLLIALLGILTLSSSKKETRELLSDPKKLAKKEAIIRDAIGWTPLHHAAKGGQEFVVSSLIGKGAKVNVADDYGWTPLHIAVFGKSAKVVELLLNKGADVNAQTKDGETPLMWAKEKGFEDIAKLLVRRGAKGEQRDLWGKTANDYAKGQ